MEKQMNKSLTLCASLALITSFAAAEGLEGFNFGLGAGFIATTIGEADGTKANIGAETTSATTGNVKSLHYARPAITVGGSFALGEGRFKLSAEAFVSDSDKLEIYSGGVTDGSNTKIKLTTETAIAQGTVPTNAATEPLESNLASIFNYSSTQGKIQLAQANGTKRITQGLIQIDPTFPAKHTGRVVNVEPKLAFSVSAEYVFGEDTDGASLGLSMLRTEDEFTYTHNNTPFAAVTTGVSIHDATNTIEHTAVTNSTADTKYEESALWFGPCASAHSELSDTLQLSASFGYYYHEFDAKVEGSKHNFINKSTDATCFTGSAKITFAPSSDDDSSR